MKRIVVCLALGLVGAPGMAEENKPVPTYTNEDLQRVSPYRDQLGAFSQPGPATAEPKASGSAPRGRGEEYWRREAERLHERLRPLRQKAAELRLRIQKARRAPGGGAGRPSRTGARSGGRAVADVEALELRLSAVEDEIRERESSLEERARRAGALPGWIR